MSAATIKKSAAASKQPQQLHSHAGSQGQPPKPASPPTPTPTRTHTHTHARAIECGCALLCATAGVLVYLNSLDGKFAYDDKVAVAGNPDVVRPDVAWRDLLFHDYWGNALALTPIHTHAHTQGQSGNGSAAQAPTRGWTHHSWRPLVVATFKWNWLMGAGRVRPFHVTNVAIHAISCILAYILMRTLTHTRARRSKHGGIWDRDRVLALVGGVLFALHPIKSECIANITSRADALASVFQFGALALYIHFCARASMHTDSSSAAHNNGRATAAQQPRNAAEQGKSICASVAVWAAMLLLGLLAMACKETSLMLPVLAGSADIAVAMVKAARAMHDKRFVQLAAERQAASSAVEPTGSQGQVTLSTGEPQTARTAAVTPALANGGSAAQSVQSSKLAVPPIQGPRSLSVVAWVTEYAVELVRAMPWLRFCALLVLAWLAYYVRVVVMARGYALHEWANPLHNKLYHIKEAFPRLASIAVVQAFALSSLVLPLQLSHEHNAMQLVTSLADPRLLLVVVVWVMLLAVVGWTLAALYRLSTGSSTMAWESARRSIDRSLLAEHEETSEDAQLFRVLYCLAFIALAYFPSSHAVQYVAFVMAERTLYLPSLAASLLVAELLTSQYFTRGENDPRTQFPGTSSITAVAPRSVQSNFGLSAAPASPPMPQNQATATACMKSKGGCSRVRRAGVSGILAALLAYYAVRTWKRNYDWVDEEALMRSNLELYPIDNPMTVYGMGALALYRGRVQEAEALLHRSIAESTMVEPYILLSQLHWKYYANDSSFTTARRILERVAKTSTPRKEILTNLGLLMMREGPPADGSINMTEWRRQYEYYVLAAHVAHGYPERHAAIGLLASNAGCMRLLSDAHRYGEPKLAEENLLEAVDMVQHGGSQAAFRNIATLYAVQGDADAALAMLDRGEALIRRQLFNDETEYADTSDPYAKEARLKSVMHDREMIAGLQRMRISIQVHRTLIDRFRELGFAVGPAAEERMSLLGVECYLELLWW